MSKAKAKPAPKKAAKKKKAKGDAPADAISIAGHPRAAAQVRKAKGWGGLLAFLATAYLSLSHGATVDVAGARALAAGVGGYVIGWAASVTIWRQLMMAELRARVERARGGYDRAPAPASAAPDAAPTQN